jgi:elongation factor Tu
MDAIDSYIPEPERDIDKPFLMPMEDVFSITGRGTVATGRDRAWHHQDGRQVEIVGIRDTARRCVTGVEMFRKILDEGRRVTTSVCCFAGTKRTSRARSGDLQAGLGHAAHEVQGEVYILTKEEGGRHTPFFTGTVRSSTSGRRT